MPGIRSSVFFVDLKSASTVLRRCWAFCCGQWWTTTKH